jgi:uncharacterized protein (TIGR03085 family)
VTYAQSERAALCDLFGRLGPDAPTLCAGWTTADLAAHLVVRERRLDAAAGIGFRPLAPYTAAVQRRIRTRRSWPELVELVRGGPGRWSPYGLVPGLDAAVNTLEFLVHHEDVRRAQPGWEPRELPAGLQDVVWARHTGMLARLMLRRAPVGVILRRTGAGAAGERAGGKIGEPHVIVSGEPAELLLFAFGRQEHARVTCDGDETAVETLRSARLGT